MKLAAFGFNVYQIFVPDLMHEFELGMWKAVLTHLIRILIAAGGDLVQQFDQRSDIQLIVLTVINLIDVLQILRYTNLRP